MSGEMITVFGGSGFVGRHAVRALVKAGKRVRVAMRRPHLGQDLRVMGDVGQVQLVQANVRDADSVARALDGAAGAVNLVGILYESGRQTFEGTQAGGARLVAEAAAAAGIARFVHMSAIGTGADSASAYARSKAAGEAAVLAALPGAAILRPSIIFGPEDDFFNRFAAMARVTPALPLIGGGHTRFQPVFVGDVAEAIVRGLDRPGLYELGGPRVYTFRELLAWITREIDRPRLLAPLPFALAEILGGALDLAFRLWPFAGPPLTADQVRLLKSDNVVSPGAAGFAELGIGPLETVEANVPAWLVRFKPHGQFQPRRGLA